MGLDFFQFRSTFLTQESTHHTEHSDNRILICLQCKIYYTVLNLTISNSEGFNVNWSVYPVYFLGGWKCNLQWHLTDLILHQAGWANFLFQLENPKANWIVTQITWTCFFCPHISAPFLAVGSTRSLADFLGITCDVPFYLLRLWCFCKEKAKRE